MIARACEGWSLSEGCETFLTAGCSESHCARALAFSECALPRSASVSTPCGTPVQVRGGLDVGVGFDVGEWALRGSGQGASGRAWGRACECVGCGPLCLDELEGVEGREGAAHVAQGLDAREQDEDGVGRVHLVGVSSG